MSEYNGLLGVSPTNNGYQVSVWAPHAKSVALIGEFNDWDCSANPMNRADGGVWWLDTQALENGAQYKFAIETQAGDILQKNDPRARKLTNSAGNSLVYDDNFQWQHNDFTPAAISQCVIYEMHIGTFNKIGDEHGTFTSAIEKLNELKALGVNMLEIMPVNEFAGDLSWGYNPAYPFAVEEAYGGPDGLKQFIDAAHGMGMGVILDVVYNHFGPSDLDIWQFDGWQENDKGGIYFYNDGRSSTPWGETRPDYGRQEVRDYIRDNALMWLREFRADGLRMDMVPYIRTVSGMDSGDDDIPEAYELIKSINGTIRAEFPEKITIAEDLHNHSYITDAPENGGCGYTSQWDAAFVHPVRNVLTQSSDEHVNLDEVIPAIMHMDHNNPFSRVVYTESHDEVANGQARLVEEVAPGNVDDDFFARQKGILAGVLVLTSAGIPMLFQGQDFKEFGWFDDNDDLHWQRKETFTEYAKAFAQLVSLRINAEGNSHGLTTGGTEIVHQDNTHKVLGYRRFDGDSGQKIYVYINFTSFRHENYQLQGLPADAECLFAWEDDITTDEVAVKDGHTALAPYSALIFSGS